MSSLTLAVDAALALGTAGLFAYVGQFTLRRTGSAQDVRAIRLFAVFWFGISLSTLLGAALNMLAIAGVTSVAPYVLLSNLGIVPLVFLLWGLVYYLLYIYTGNVRLFWPVTLASVALLAWLTILIGSLDATGIRVETWRVSTVYTNPPSPLTTTLLLAVILVPVVGASAAYGTLYWRTHDVSARYRIRMVSSGFLLWFGGLGLASATTLAAASWWPPVSRGIALAATAMILAAYRPPRAIRQRLQVDPTPARSRAEEAGVARERVQYRAISSRA